MTTVNEELDDFLIMEGDGLGIRPTTIWGTKDDCSGCWVR